MPQSRSRLWPNCLVQRESKSNGQTSSSTLTPLMVPIHSQSVPNTWTEAWLRPTQDPRYNPLQPCGLVDARQRQRATAPGHKEGPGDNNLEVSEDHKISVGL